MADKASKQSLPDRLPLVVGVTGHRDLRDEDIPKLEQAVDRIFERLKHDYLRGDSKTPLIILSSLAEGADRLVARVAMRHGARLIAPLPMEADEYRRDFAPGLKPDAAAEFNRLLAESLAAPIVGAGADLNELAPTASARSIGYREVGLFIVRHCHILIALYSGDEKQAAIGGTMEVVKFRRTGIPLDVSASARASLDAPEIGPVIYVVTPRAKEADAAKAVEVRPWGHELINSFRGGRIGGIRRKSVSFVKNLLFARDFDEQSAFPPDARRDLESWESFEIKIRLTVRFNAEANRLSKDHGARAETNRPDLFEDRSGTNSGREVKERVGQLIPRWCAMFTIADRLAMKSQARFKLDWLALFLLGFVAIVSFEVVTHLFRSATWLFAIYTLVFVGVFTRFAIARLGQHQERFLDYRALAEALRVAVFWKLLGIGASPGRHCSDSAKRSDGADLGFGQSIADAYPIRQPSELDWVKTCLRTLELLDEDRPFAKQHHPEAEGRVWARKFWIDGQLDFYRRRAPRHNRLAEGLESHSFVLLSLSIALSAALFALGYRLLGRGLPHWEHEELPHRVFIFLIGLWPGLAAVIAGYSEKLALKAQARQYDRMRTLFERAHELLSEQTDSTSFCRVQALYQELGAEVLKENAAWVEIYRQRPIRPPQG